MVVLEAFLEWCFLLSPVPVGSWICASEACFKAFADSFAAFTNSFTVFTDSFTAFFDVVGAVVGTDDESSRRRIGQTAGSRRYLQ